MKRFWTDGEIEMLKQSYPNMQSLEVAKILNCNIERVYNKAFSLGLKKENEYLNSERSGRLMCGDKRGINTRFHKGHEPFNKGKEWSDYMSKKGRLNSLKTTFKKGHLPLNTKTDGEISIRNNDGRTYKYIRMSLGKWIPLHIYEWEKANGIVPENMIVVFRNKDSMNCTLSNLELITREENMMRNTWHKYPQELKDAMKKLKQLKKQINGKE